MEPCKHPMIYGILLNSGILEGLGATFRTPVWKELPSRARCPLQRSSAKGFLLCGSFRKLGVPYFGVLIIRILLFRVLD